MRRYSPYDGRSKRRALRKFYNLDTNEDFESFICELYVEHEMSAPEISEEIMGESGVEFTTRSVQRIVAKHEKSRSAKDSFRLAMSKGKVKWEHQRAVSKSKRSKLAPGLRYKILERDGFRCKLCGVSGDDSLLEVDHVIAVSRGGSDDESNLRTLCYDCNVGKRIHCSEGKVLRENSEKY